MTQRRIRIISDVEIVSFKCPICHEIITIEKKEKENNAMVRMTRDNIKCVCKNNLHIMLREKCQ